MDSLKHFLGLLLFLVLYDAHLIDTDQHQLDVGPERNKRVILAYEALDLFSLTSHSPLKSYKVLRPLIYLLSITAAHLGC